MRAVLALALTLLCAPCTAETLAHGRFDNVQIHRPEGTVEHVVLLLSGDEGWNAELDVMARKLAAAGTLVAGIDMHAFAANLDSDADGCESPDGDLENLSHFVQAYYRLPSYEPPTLVGVDSGGAFVYAMLAQAPSGTFSGGVSLAFCPELDIAAPLCESEHLAYEHRDGATHLLPRKLPAPWVSLERENARCERREADEFIAKAGGDLIELTPTADARGGSEERLVPQLQLALGHVWSEAPRSEAATPAPLRDLPLVEMRAHGDDPRLAVILSGDGGWAHIDKELAATFIARGVSVVGLDSLRYFWKRHTPQSTADDVGRILRYYQDVWGKSRALLIGYSQGAGVLPFVVNRLDTQTRSSLALVALLAPGLKIEFEFHLSDWFRDDLGMPVLPELQRMTALPVLCLYGADEEDSLCRESLARNVRKVQLPGGHHFDGNYSRIADMMLDQK